MTAPAPDETIRVRISTHLEETLFVDAGAGSGKTTQLVNRVVQHVSHGTPMAAIAAITFTEAAAAELREKIRHRLEDVAASTTDDATRALLRTALDEVDQAALQTLHAFAQSILRRFPIEAGLPPSLEISDEISSALAFDERFDAFQRELFDDLAWQPLLRRFLLLGLREEHLRDLARYFDDHYDRLTPGAGAGQPPPIGELDAAPLIEMLEEALALRDRCAEEADHLARHLDDRIAPVSEWLRHATADQVVVELSTGDKWASTRGKAPSWNGAKPDVVDALARAQELRELMVAADKQRVVEALSRQVQAFVLGAAADRRRQGTLEFHDLLVLVRELLREHPDIRAQLADTHRFLLVDEFQDTDPLQIELVSLIAGGHEPATSWEEVVIEAGRLFFVGDPKQSIYRFRRADVELYGRAREHYRAGVCELSANFRTVPGVIDWVNTAFARLMPPDDGHQPAYASLTAVREPLNDDRAPVTVIGGPRQMAAEALRQEAGRELAGLLNTMVAEKWPVADGDGERHVGFGDIVVLVPSRLSVPALSDAFDEAGVPFRLETASLIWSSQEIRDVLSVLSCVEDPGDQVSLVAALRSPMFGCGDDDLARWALAKGRWSYLFPGTPDLPADHPVAVALGELRDLYERKWFLGPDGLVEELASRFATFQLALLAGSRRDRWRRLRFLADQAQAYAETQRGGLDGFLKWAAMQMSDTVRVSSPILPEADLESVRVMTIHASKGLEFPVVALFGLGATARRRGGVAVLWGDEGPQVRLNASTAMVGYDSLVPADEQMERNERIRLLYVASTRARDRLIVCAHHKVTAKGLPSGDPLAHLLTDGLEDAPGVWERWEPSAASVGGDVRHAPAVTVAAPDSPEAVAAAIERDAFLAARAALLAPERSVWSATAVASAHASADASDQPPELDPGALEPAVDAPDDQRAWRRGRAGTAIGRAVHGTLQLCDLDTLADLDAIARTQAEVEGVAGAIDTVAGLARSGATAAVVRDLVSRTHWREMYVAAPVGDTVVEGYVDLVADDRSGGLVVLDYKTDAVRTGDDVAARTERYRLQAATYALALESITGRPVTDALFLFLTARGAVESHVADLEAAKTDVRKVLAGV
ncbi:MAG TPA: UvrD-helicase domain-containing protein [Microthrixaceae bacterium]|nr:UvrD-helicase domain-containing protein [Microthrixaceae bacterium]